MTDLRALAFRSLPREHGFEPLTVEGRLPPELSGTLYFNGPGCFDSHGRAYTHWFDGDGAVTAVRLAGGSAWGACRVIESPQLSREREAGRPLYSSGATRGPSVWRRLGGRSKNTANINNVQCDGRLLALGEAYRPIEIDRDDLRSLGETDLGGEVPSALGAHYRTIASRGRRFGMALEYGRKTILRVLELPERSAPREITRLRLPHATVMLHDLAVTQKHLLFFVPPITISVAPLLLGLRAPLEAPRWLPQRGSEVIVVPLDHPDRPIRFRVPAFFMFHFAGAHDDGDDIVVDFVGYDDFSIFDHLRLDQRRTTPAAHRPNGAIRRARVRPRSESVTFETVTGWTGEFPRTVDAVAGRRHDHAWLVGAEHPDDPSTVFRLDSENAEVHPVPLGERRLPSEACPIERGDGELDTWVATLVYDADTDRSHLAIIDGASPEAGPVARVWFDHRIPPPFHGNWYRGEALPNVSG